jgi:hypothetical protein
VAAAIASTSRLVGISLGVAIIGSIVVSAQHDANASIASASHPGWWLSVACGVVVAVLGFASTTPSALRTARAVEEFAAG